MLPVRMPWATWHRSPQSVRKSWTRTAKASHSGALRRGVRIEPLEPRTLLTTLAGIVYFDVNADGQQNGDESGISGISVYLDQNRNGRRDSSEAATMTESDGGYRFEVDSGIGYRVRVDLTNEWIQTSPGPMTGPGLLGDVVQVIDYPTSYSTGMTADGTWLWVISSYNWPYSVHQVSPETGAIVSTFAAPNQGALIDLQFDRVEDGVPYFWGIDLLNAVIMRFNNLGQIDRQFGIPAEIQRPTGITLAHDTLWVTDEITASIHQLDPATGSILSSFAGPDSQMYGLTYDGRYLWTNGADTQRTYALDPDTGGIASSFVLPGVEQPFQTGITYDAAGLWLGLFWDDRLVRIDLGFTASLDVSVSDSGFADADFGVCRLGTVTGTVFDDRDNDGSQDAGEQGLSGWRVYVDLNENGTYDIAEASDITGPDGGYRLTNVRPGIRDIGLLLRQPGFEGPSNTVAFTVDGSGDVLTQDFAQRWVDFGPIGPEFRVNATTVGEQSMPAVAMDAQGNAVIVWTGPEVARISPLYAQRYNSTGDAVGPEFLVTNSFAQYNGQGPAVAMAGDGQQFVIAWHDAAGIYAQRYRGTEGTTLGKRITIATLRASDVGNVTAVTADYKGNFAVSYRIGSYFAVQRYDYLGNPQGKLLTVKPTGSNSYTRGTVAMASDGSYVVAWRECVSNKPKGVYAQLYSASGKAVGTRVYVGDSNVDSSVFLAAIDASHGFAVVWTADGLGYGTLYACRTFNADGTARGSELQFLSQNQDVALVMQENGDFVLSGNVGADIVAQRFTRSGQPKDPQPFVVNTTRSGEQRAPAAAVDVRGNLLVAWSGVGVTDGEGIFAQRFTGPPQTLHAEASGASDTTAALTLAQAEPLLNAALAQWQATGVNVAALAGLSVQIADLGGTTLGLAAGNTIWLDDDAAGWGWFVDATPHDDREFLPHARADAQQRIDLLTVVLHEMGHLLGREHAADGLMAETLATGARRSVTNDPHAAAVDHWFAQSLDLRAGGWLSDWLTEQLQPKRAWSRNRR